jgi:hypothetical protein
MAPLKLKGESATCANMPGPGGSRKGIKNLRTQYREYQRVAKNFRGDQFVGESLAIMGKAMHFFAEMAMRAETPEEARIC